MSDDVALMSLEAMRFFGRIGHTEAERTVGTHVEVDVDLEIPLEEGPSHSLERTIDYRQIHDRVEAVISEGEHPLLEGLAEAILDALESLGWRRCVVRVRKRSPPISGTMGAAQIQLERSRDEGPAQEP